jgi:hypothetical protein
MRIRRPSPGTVISTIALVMAMSGSAFAGAAAVEFARNAGAVDGKSAVDAGSSNNRAKGNLVATARGGSNTGQIPNKFLADVPEARPLALALPVEDNQQGGAVDLVTSPLGRFTLACQDQANAAGTEDPRMVLAFTNTSGGTVNVARRAGVGEATIGTLANGTVDQFSIATSNTFRIHLQKDATQVIIEGAARQDRPDPANGACGVYAAYEVIR